MISDRLKPLLLIRIQFVLPSKQNPLRLIKTSNLMLLSELIAVFSEKHIKHINSICRLKVIFLLASVLLLPEVRMGEAW
jgi:hypothetical protein